VFQSNRGVSNAAQQQFGLQRRGASTGVQQQERITRAATKDSKGGRFNRTPDADQYYMEQSLSLYQCIQIRHNVAHIIRPEF
jgi:hypothetical protein